MRRIVIALAAILGSTVFVSPASATISPTVTLDQSAGTAAGSTVNLGMDLKFAPSGTDSPKDLTISLPAGLLANASINGGACLKSATPMSACQVGSGTVSADVTQLGIPVPLPPLAVTFDLVAPPKPADLAGVQLMLSATNSPLGSPADITVRPASAPGGVGLNLSLSNVPDSFDGASISVTELNTTLTGLRLPASCPSPAANLTVSADSYGDPTAKTASAPLQVTDCSALPFAPQFNVTATQDSGDPGVQVVTDITQKPDEATSKSVALKLPSAVLSPNLQGIITGGLLCTDPTFATCKTIGSASSTSPLYPTPLTGKVYLTAAPAIAIVFPPPFSITLAGSVNLGTNTTTFTGVPDIPLTDLKVSLNGGPDAAFATSCTAAGTASSTLTTQNGDRTTSVDDNFTVANFSGSNCTSGGGNGGGGKGGGGGRNGGGRSAHLRVQVALSGLARGKPKLGLILAAGSAKIRALKVKLPSGLRWHGRRVGHKLTIAGVASSGGGLRSVVILRGWLVITLRGASSGVIVKVSPSGLRESKRLKQRVQHRKSKRLRVKTTVTDAQGHTTTFTAVVKRFR
jgi:hypothetical protein